MTTTAAIVLNYFGADKTEHCIRSLVGQQLTTLVLVDNSADDAEQRRLDAAVETATAGATDFALHRICNGENLGFGRAVNRAIAADIDRTGGHDYYLLLNNDAVLTSGTLGGLLAAAKADPRRALISPRIRLDQRAVSYHWYQPYVGAVSATRLPGAFPYLNGCCLLIDARIIENATLFDEAFFMYGEDVLLSARILRMGRAIYCDEDLLALHEGSGSSRHGGFFYEYHVARGHILLTDRLSRNRLERVLMVGGRLAFLTVRGIARAWRYGSAEPLQALLRAWKLRFE